MFIIFCEVKSKIVYVLLVFCKFWMKMRWFFHLLSISTACLYLLQVLYFLVEDTLLSWIPSEQQDSLGYKQEVFEPPVPESRLDVTSPLAVVSVVATLGLCAQREGTLPCCSDNHCTVCSPPWLWGSPAVGLWVLSCIPPVQFCVSRVKLGVGCGFWLQPHTSRSSLPSLLHHVMGFSLCVELFLYIVVKAKGLPRKGDENYPREE